MSELAEGSAIGPYPYRIIRRLGHKQGNMADVYLAAIGDILDSSQVNLVVVKITRQDETHGEFFRATLENEVERLRRLKHPGIVRLYPIQREGLRNLPYMAQASLPGRPWFSVMEYLAGDSLAYLLQERRQLDIGAAMEIARSLAATLDYIHNLNQVHLDIKPQNILFREPLQGGKDPQPVLIDFGIARLTGQAGLEAGTLQWLAPERVRFVRGDKPPELMVRPHPSMDIYALGMVLYVMIAGRLPYSERTRKGITTAILDGSPTAPSTYHRMVHKDLDDLVLMALAADPSQRPTADEFARALEELSIRLGYRSHYGHLAPIPAAAARAVSSGGRSRAKLAAVALGGLVLVQSLALGALALPRLTDDPTGLTPTPVAPTDQTPTPAGTEVPTQLPVLITDTAVPAAPTTDSLVAPTAPPAAPVTPAPIATPKQISTSLPTRTPIPTRTPVPATPAATPDAQAAATPRPPSASALTVALAGPANGSTVRGRQTFSWRWNGALPPDQAFEVVIYKPGVSALNGYGLTVPTADRSVTVDLDALNNSNHPLNPGPWLWGVNLVQRDPYRALQSLASGWQFNYAP
jgi:tRNA A-37 threonylcarbamoyl transferase component Bud32